MAGARWPHQRGPQTEPFERRYGYQEVPGPGGVNSLKIPTALAPHEFRVLLNARWEGDSIKPRGGMLSIIPQREGEAIHPWQTYEGSPTRLYMLGQGCPDADAALGFCVAYYDENRVPVAGRATWYKDAANIGSIGVFGGLPHLSVQNELRRFYVTNPNFGDEVLGDAGQNLDVTLAKTTAGDIIRALVSFTGLFFLLTDNGKIYAWDGVSLQLDKSGVSDPKAGIVLNGELMFIIHDDGSVSYRVRGSVPGTYTVAAAAGTLLKGEPAGLGPADIISWGPNGGASFRDAVYHAEPSNAANPLARIFKIDTTGATVAHTINGVGAGTRCKTLVNYPGQGLFYAWGEVDWLDPDATSDPKIGFYDGTMWTDNFNDFDDNAPPPPLLPEVSQAIDALLFYRNRMAVLPGMFPYVSNDLLIANPNTWRMLADSDDGWRFTFVRHALVF